MFNPLPRYLNDIIINYLTPLPKLPFSDELITAMHDIFQDLNYCIYYENYYWSFISDTGFKHYIKCTLLQAYRPNAPFIGNSRYIRYPVSERYMKNKGSV